MEIGGKNVSDWWELFRVYAERWSGRRTFVVAAALLFGLLAATGAVATWVAFLSVLTLTGVVIMHSLLLGEPVGRIRVSAPVAQSGFAGLASGAGRTILIEMPDPVIVLDSGGRIIFCNRAAEGLIGPQANGKHVATMLRSAPLMTAIDEVLQGDEAQTVSYSQPVPVERNYTAFITPIETDTIDTGAEQSEIGRKRSRAVLVVLRDVTEARRVEDMRVDFVAFASHELKTPLASLSGFIDTLRGHAKNDPEAQEKFLAIMADQADRMRRLIEDLLSLSRIELKEHVRPHKIVDMLAVVSDVTDGLEHVAEKNGMTLTVTSAAVLPRVKGEAEELAQVVQNLVDNALRYGRSGKRVEVSLAPDTRGGKPMLRLSVRDFGEGISREHLPRLTERFYRVDAAASRAKGGTGLGLAIVKHIVNRHQGTLSIDSELGEGSTFTVLIPAAGDEISA
ncbi:MAG: ATP-binding protein [Parvibaculum sp.]|nr:ATP-binding protein [Parvibaculum sp.]